MKYSEAIELFRKTLSNPQQHPDLGILRGFWFKIPEPAEVVKGRTCRVCLLTGVWCVLTNARPARNTKFDTQIMHDLLAEENVGIHPDVFDEAGVSGVEIRYSKNEDTLPWTTFVRSSEDVVQWIIQRWDETYSIEAIVDGLQEAGL